MFKVKVPGTSANMGPGFDAVGIALDIYNEYEFSEIESGLVFEGVPEEFCNEDNIVYKAMLLCFKKGQYKHKGIKIKVLKQDIPISRGLGSSSSCIVAGLIGANEIMGQKLSKDEIFNLAVEIEGHPDNVAPAIFGGMVISIQENGMPLYNKIIVGDDLRFVALIPDFRLSTEDARKVLPKEIKFSDGVYNVARVAFMISCLVNKNYNMLKDACKDKLHQPYRSKLIKSFDCVYNKCYDIGSLCCYLSGAGPTMMNIIEVDDEDFLLKIRDYLRSENLNWGVIQLKIDNQGARSY